MGSFLDRANSLSRFDFIGVSIFDQLLRYNFTQRLAQLERVCISSHFLDQTVLGRFLNETLPALDYLELSSVQLGEELIHKCSEKFKQLVVFGAPDLPHNKRQHLLGKYTIAVTIVYARDFPLNLKPVKAVTTDNLMFKGVTKQPESRAEMQHVGEGITTTTNRSTMEESAARILASSRDNNPQTRAAATMIQQRINNNKAGIKPDTRLSRDAMPGEIKFKQIKLTNKNTNFEVILLVRKQ